MAYLCAGSELTPRRVASKPEASPMCWVRWVPDIGSPEVALTGSTESAPGTGRETSPTNEQGQSNR
jgi:hypothetical protein